MDRARAAVTLATMAALSAGGLLLPWYAVGMIAVAAVSALRSGRTTFLLFAASTLLINAVLFAWLLPAGPTIDLGVVTLGLAGAERGLVGALRLVAVVGANLAILSMVGPERLLDGLRLPALATTFIAAVVILAHDLGRDFRRLVDARRLDARWPQRLPGKVREAVRLLPPLLVLAVRRAQVRREALRLAGHDTPALFAPLVAVTALGVAGRLVLLGLPNIAFTYVIVFLGGLLFGVRVGVLAGLLTMALTDLMLTGLLPAPFANAPAMALIGLMGGALRGFDFSGGNRVERWSGRLLAFSAGLVGVMLFSAASDALTWLMVPEYRSTPGAFRLLLLAGFAFNLVPALVNAFLFAASAGPVSRAFLEIRSTEPASGRASWDRSLYPDIALHARSGLMGTPPTPQTKGPGPAFLVLEDGSVFEGEAFGFPATAYGELVFNTGMTGYQESLTDPSYHGQVLMFTYPMIGNYGVNPEDWESDRVWPRAVVVREWCKEPSHRKSTMTLHDWLTEQKVPGISGVDTRALTLKVRAKGCLRCFVTHDPAQVAALKKKVLSMPSVEVENLAAEASVQKMRKYGRNDAGTLKDGSKADPKAYTVAVIDTGIKRNILRNLARRFNVLHMPWNATSAQVEEAGADCLFIANGPGDPAHPEIQRFTVPTIREVSEKVPTFGICYGNQLVSLAWGAKTSKMRFGHRGANIPSRDEFTGIVRMTSQNHGFHVDADTVKGTGLVVWEKCPNDGVVEAVRHERLPIFTMQYHPEASPGPWDSNHFFDQFWQMVDQCKRGKWKPGAFPKVVGSH